MKKFLVIIFCLGFLTTGIPSFADDSYDVLKNEKSISILIAKKVHVKGYYRKNGTYVKPHTRNSPGTKSYTPKRSTKRYNKSETYNPKQSTERYKKNKKTKRSSSARREFMKQTGYAKGRPGYIVDHIIPLACGGCDCPSNMQWQTIAEAKAKDRWERRDCR